MSEKITKYNLEYEGVLCTGVQWGYGRFYFTKDGKEYEFDQTEDIQCVADTDHIRCVIKEQFLPWIKDEHIKELQAENAALRERLDRAVELPCKIGEEGYEIHGKCAGGNCPFNGYYGQWRCHYGGGYNCAPFITIKQFCYSDIQRVGKTIFISKEAAEARLKELQGEE